MGKTSVEILSDIIENPDNAAYRYTLPVRLLVKVIFPDLSDTSMVK